MSIWTGAKVKLRSFEASDADYNYESWNDSETLRFREFPKLPASKNITSYYAQKDSESGPYSTDFHLIIENLDGEIVGDIGTGESDPRSGTFMIGYEIKRDFRRRGYASEAILLVLRYYFFALRYHKAWTSVYSFNDPSNSLFKTSIILRA
jgi:RimJ/RimL family protein N-acetyltransferase